MRKKPTGAKTSNAKKNCSKPYSAGLRTSPNFAPMNFQEKALEHIEFAKETLLQPPATPLAWKQLQDTLHLALEAVTLAAHHQPDKPVEKIVVPEIQDDSAPVVSLESTSADSGPSIAEALSEQRIASIQSTLSINDRVRFASDLFGGDVPKLLTVCTEIEAVNSFEAAVEHVERHATVEVDWEDEDGAAFEFLQRLRRLFA